MIRFPGRLCRIAAGVSVALLYSLKLTAVEPSKMETISLGELLPDSTQQGWGTLQVDRSVEGKPLQIGDRKFATGLGTHADSELIYLLEQPAERFEAWVGVDAEMQHRKVASVVFKVLGDGRELFNSDVMRADTPARRVSVPLTDVKELKLVVTNAGDGGDSDHADWAEAVLVRKAAPPAEVEPARFTVQSPSLTVRLAEDGAIVGVKSGRFDRPVRGLTSFAGCDLQGKIITKELPGGGMLFSRTLTDAKQRHSIVNERFLPTKNSVRWEVEITGDGEPWSTPIITRLFCDSPDELRFWAAWSEPERHTGVWSDPLAMTPFANRNWHYGNATQAAPVGGDYVALPMVTVAAPGDDSGFSLVHSPEDILLNMTLAVSSSGQIRFARTNHRLGSGKTVRFAMDLVGHEADWRGGLRWTAERYPQFFDPPNPRAHEMAGCAAYSGDERPIDAAKFKKMAFRINWKLSDDFPYMGMYIPPVKTAEERWTRSCGEPAPTGKPDTISGRQMNDYARWMKEHGFHVLNYFNVTEFGKDMKDAEIPASRADEPDLWKDPVAYIKMRMPNAAFRNKLPNMYYGAWLVDVGDPDYRRFMLDQAQRHIEFVPDSDGICIDRMDWLRCYNPDGDDGVSWVDGKPARSLYQSWHMFMKELGPLMHDADKVIFGNTMTMRLELNRQLDGIYSEHADNPGALNAASIMGIRKPVLAWTYRETLDQPDPDSFFQRHLHLGVYPTAPYPFNHHCITPDPTAEKFYMDYGPLLDAMRGKKWVLAPHCVETVTSGVKVNLFEVPGGYVLPVTMGGKSESATVRLRNINGLDRMKCHVQHPGAEGFAEIPAVFANGELKLQVSLKRGCAMVQIKPADS